MDWSTHQYLHETVGARTGGGGAGTFGNLTATMTACDFHDDDIEKNIPQTSVFRVLYRNASAQYDWVVSTTVYYKQSAAKVLQFNNVNTLTDVTTNRYVAYWIYLTADPVNPYWVITGQREGKGRT